jgi:beta-lactamase superfamily II metal-dependent hydrolase
VSPEVAVISVGENNPYRHPSPETLSAYHALKTRVYRTDQDGAVLVETDGKVRRVWTYEDNALHPVLWRRGMAAAEASNLMKIFHSYWFGPA